VPAPPSTDVSSPAALREALGGRTGRDYWRSLEALAATPEFAAVTAARAPSHAALLAEPVDRRDFLRLMGASLALAGVTGCTRQPEERVVPYVKQPERLVLGEPLFFATAMTLGGFATGVLVESHEGRPTKIEGNPEHPASLGATDPLTQASVLGLYDPDRSKTVLAAGEIRPWKAFVDALQKALTAQRARGGAGLRLLTETVTSPALADQIRDLLRAFPRARWHQWQPLPGDGGRLGSRLAFGEMVATRYRLERADVVLALDADVLGFGPAALRYARDFARRRRAAEGTAMNRLYAVESTFSITGAKADHRLPLRATDVEPFARALAAALGVRARADAARLEGHDAFVAALARDLQRHRGRSVVIPGDGQPAAVHALAHAMNQALGNVGQTVEYTDPVEAENMDQGASLAELVEAMDQGQVEVLVIVGGNPVFTAPADLRFAERLERVGLRVHHGLYYDETGVRCHWHVPEAHYLESWGDARAYDGTVSIVQPLIAPLYEGRTAYELLAALSDRPERTAHDVVREFWRGQLPGADAEAAWRKVLHDGVVPGTALAPRRLALRADWDAPPAPFAGQLVGDLELVFRPDPSVYDGRFANNGWLQELPRPLTKLTWDNAALIAPATAARLGLATGDVVRLVYRARTLRAPVWVLPGQPEDSVALALGYGRERSGRIATGVGCNPYALRTSEAPGFGLGLAVDRVGTGHAFANTQEHHAMEGRAIARSVTLSAFQRDPGVVRDGGPVPSDSLYPDYRYPGHAWGMTIDLGACIGCNACTVACQAENNIPVVGKDQVARGREMHWIRVDRYWTGPAEAPATIFQPVPCMHCETAPCEVVCPVNATVHSSEGLNDMVYNRCVGTRYCSNNCPYKVRRFNFYLYQDWHTESLKMVRNPDVTVRSRGVMEKCTYCVQRIERARAHAITADRPLRDGDVVTACQQACPTEAIVFGDQNDRDGRLARTKRDPRNYGLLEELNTRPRTTYLAEVRNPNPELAGEPA
jgi:MoCo/4Fe-4S cofactor protein with predicted Tat translocation signal